MDTNCRKRLRQLEIAVLHESGGSRKAAEAVAWFSETAHIAFEGSAGKISANTLVISFNHISMICEQTTGHLQLIGQSERAQRH